MPMSPLGVALTFLTFALPAQAASLRYALVVGNNRGLDAGHSQPFPDLKHAEHDAQALHERLVQVGNFSPERTRLLLGATHAEVEQAFAELRELLVADQRALAGANTLFLVFFTGHGLSGRLLLDDGPLAADTLGALVRSIGADVTLGIFDACFSGSLDRGALAEKGIRPTPGLNIFQELPEEVLTAEGSIWLVSSGPLGASYEDEKLGGVFSHFLIEAFDKAPRDGPGITLEQIWSYVRSHTMRYTSSRGRQQVPEQYVAKLKSTGPLYLSFPVPRSASLVLTSDVAGQFALSYAEGQWTEIIAKRAGSERRLAVYPGLATLMFIRDGSVHLHESLTFVEGGTVVVQNTQVVTASTRPGAKSVELWRKGSGADSLAAVTDVMETSLIVAGGYDLVANPPATLGFRHLATLGGRLDHGRWVVAGRLSYGMRDENFPEWRYRSQGVEARVLTGITSEFNHLRLSAGFGLEAGWVHQRYGDGLIRQRLLGGALAEIACLWAVSGNLMLELRLHGGPLLAPGAGSAAPTAWRMQGGAGAALGYAVFN